METATLDHRARFLLLASDGLWENLSKPEVLSAMEEAMVSHDVSVEFIPAQLIKMALERAAERHNVRPLGPVIMTTGDVLSAYRNASLPVFFRAETYAKSIQQSVSTKQTRGWSLSATAMSRHLT